MQDARVPTHGLTDVEVRKKHQTDGYNELPKKKKSAFRAFVRQFQNVTVYILIAATVISLLLPWLTNGELGREEFINAVVIAMIVILNAVLGFAQERRAERSIELLQELSAPQVKVYRSGKLVIIPSRELVTGDIIAFEAGDRISADANIIRSSSLMVNESSLTGESMPVSKTAVPSGTKKQDEQSMVFAGTLVTRGSAVCRVSAIGINTEIGKVSSMLMETKAPETPLQSNLKHLGERIGIIVLGICILLFIIGYLRGIALMQMFFTAVSLAVAAVPEGLPAIVTICLAVGVQRMIHKHALIRRIDAIETLGNITVICADKTGTMTENSMCVIRTHVFPGMSEKLLAEVAASSNTAQLPDIGDPTEIALLEHAQKQNVERQPIIEETIPFTSEEKYMATTHQKKNRIVHYYKGAPEVIAKLCGDERIMDEVNAQMAGEGLRVLAIAMDTGEGIQPVGLIGMMDPPRKGVKEGIGKAKKAGIRTIMITGDNPMTAMEIAKRIGIRTATFIDGTMLETMTMNVLREKVKTVSVFARVRPEHKVKILQALQANGEIVAMTGDGVNDAPALKSAHVGIAMGLKGTDIARESAAMVLTDDNYATIVEAVAEGRRIYDNIRKFVVFLLRTNIGEVFIISFAVLLALPLPLLPLHILWINLVTDSLPALALAAEKGSMHIMSRPPRTKAEHLLTGQTSLTLIAGLLNAGIVLVLFMMVLHAYHENLILAQTTALTATIVFQMFIALATRVKHSVVSRNPFANPWLIAAIAVTMLLHLVLIYTPLALVFSVTPLPVVLWSWIVIGTLGAFIVFELMKYAQAKMMIHH